MKITYQASWSNCSPSPANCKAKPCCLAMANIGGKKQLGESSTTGLCFDMFWHLYWIYLFSQCMSACLICRMSVYFWMSVCLYVCMHACMHVCMYVCMHACMYACMHVCMYLCMYACTYVCMSVCMPACTYVCIYLCIYACMHVLHACFNKNVYLDIRIYCTSNNMCINSSDSIFDVLVPTRNRNQSRKNMVSLLGHSWTAPWSFQVMGLSFLVMLDWLLTRVKQETDSTRWQ